MEGGSPFWLLPHTTCLTTHCDSLESKPMASGLSSFDPKLSGLGPPSSTKQVLLLSGSARYLNCHIVPERQFYPPDPSQSGQGRPIAGRSLLTALTNAQRLQGRPQPRSQSLLDDTWAQCASCPQTSPLAKIQRGECSVFGGFIYTTGIFSSRYCLSAIPLVSEANHSLPCN